MPCWLKLTRPEHVSTFGTFLCFWVKQVEDKLVVSRCLGYERVFFSDFRGKQWTAVSSEWQSRDIHPIQSSGNQCWLRDPVRPCVFWVITGFGITSAGRGHAVETGMLEPVPGRGPILLLFVLLILLSFTFSVLPPLLCQLQCVLQLAQAKPLPLRNSLCLFLLLTLLLFNFLFFFFLLFAFSFSLSFLFDTPNTSSTRTYCICAALMLHNKRQCSPLSENNRGYFTFLDCKTKDQALSVTNIYVSQSAKCTIHIYFRICFGE